MPRITDTDATAEVAKLSLMLKKRGVVKDGITFHRGSSSYKVTNKLIMDGTNLWPDGMAGFTSREAYNAARLMQAAIHAAEGDD